jgi:hypothetical protein
MRQDLKKKWVAALRSGEYLQGTGQLKNADGEYCCLGVLCEISGGEWVYDPFDGDLDPEPYKVYVGGGFTSNDELFSDGVAEYFGLSTDAQHTLANMNDGRKNGWRGDRKNFDEIADWIEKNL